MEYLKEPEDVDFIIQIKALTDKQRKEISKFIQDNKAKHVGKKSVTKSRMSSSKQKILAS